MKKPSWFKSFLGKAIGKYLNISTPYEWAEYLRSGAGMKSQSGQVVNPETAMRVSAVYACIRVLAETVAQLPLIVYRRLPDGQGKERATDHPLWKLLHDAPNRWQTSFEFREMFMGHLCLRGNAYALKSRARGRLRELIPLHPDRVQVKQEDDLRLTFEVSLKDGTVKKYEQKDIFRLNGLSFNGFTGINPIRYAREAIGLSLATEQHGSLLFKNGAQPIGVLTHPQTLTPEAGKKLKESWQEAHSGDNQFKTALLEEGLAWKPLGMTSEDSQFLETRKFQRNAIASIFRVPPHKIGDLERATFSNIEQQSIEFVTDSLMPYLRRWEQSITRDLVLPVERGEIFVEFLVDGLLRGDSKARGKFYVEMVTNGLLSPNEIREMENRNPYEGGDEFIRQLNTQTTNGNDDDDESDEDSGQDGNGKNNSKKSLVLN